MIPVLYDGWVLIRQPDNPAALHLWMLLTHHPTNVQPWVALPAPQPDWLKGDFQVIVQPASNTTWEHLQWEQRHLPRLARQCQARLLHLSTPCAPLLVSIPTVHSLTAFEKQPGEPLVFAERLRRSLGLGGYAHAASIWLPKDLPYPPRDHTLAIRPFTLPGFLPAQDIQLTDLEIPGGWADATILYHGPCDPVSLEKVLRAWSWVSGPLGDQVSLALLGLDIQAHEWVGEWVRQDQGMGKVQVIPPQPPSLVPRFYQACMALFHPLDLTPWGEPLRSALACGKPVVAALSRRAEALVGSAAYLVPQEDARALGAALISVIVETSLTERLSQAAMERAATWRDTSPVRILEEAYTNTI